jgi:MFS family permease
MLKRIRLLTGISVFWLALSLLFDGLNSLVLPLRLSNIARQNDQATILGLVTFVGLMAGALIQPVAGVFSDRLQPVLGRNKFIGFGLILSLLSLFLFSIFQSIAGVLVSYLAVQVSISIAQAGQQALIPDLVEDKQRGLASGLKGFMDLTGAMLGFLILGQFLGSGQLALAIGMMAVALVVTYIIAVLLTPEDRPIQSAAVRTTALTWREVFRIDRTHHTDFFHLLVSRFLFLLGVYGIGRFLLLFVAERLGLSPEQAAEQAGYLLASLALVTILASPLAGWLADRFGRLPLMVAGAVLSATSALLLIGAGSANQILLFGAVLSLGSAAFSGGSWALIADLVPKNESARFFGLANFSVAGSAAVAGLFGPVIDWTERMFPEYGFTMLFILAALALLGSALPLKDMLQKGISDVGRKDQNRRKERADAARLAVVPVPADPTSVEKDQDPPGRTT